MKTRNLFFVSALILFGLASVNSAMAQTSGSVILNLKFKPVQSITVNPATEHQTVDFVYVTKTDYTEGVTVANKVKHLTVFSSGGFDVSVNADHATFTSGNSELTIPVTHIMVKPTKNASNPKNTFTFTNTQLSDAVVPIISSTGGGKELDFDVEYDNTLDVNNDDYIALGYNKAKVDADGATVFTTTLTYTITTN